jgi:hypothetical protein
MVTTLTVQSQINEEGVLKIEVPCDLPPGQVEVMLTIRCPPNPAARPGLDWEGLYGLGREVWAGVDAEQYLRELREDRDLPS